AFPATKQATAVLFPGICSGSGANTSHCSTAAIQLRNWRGILDDMLLVAVDEDRHIAFVPLPGAGPCRARLEMFGRGVVAIVARRHVARLGYYPAALDLPGRVDGDC